MKTIVLAFEDNCLKAQLRAFTLLQILMNEKCHDDYTNMVGIGALYPLRKDQILMKLQKFKKALNYSSTLT